MIRIAFFDSPQGAGETVFTTLGQCLLYTPEGGGPLSMTFGGKNEVTARWDAATGSWQVGESRAGYRQVLITLTEPPLPGRQQETVT